MANYKTRIKKTRAESVANKEHNDKLEDLMEELDLFNEWKKAILPELRALLIQGASSKDIAKKYANYAAARMVTIALTDADPVKALTACKDIIDRAEGKPVESQKIEHKYQDLDDRALDSLLKSKLNLLEGNSEVVVIDSEEQLEAELNKIKADKDKLKH